MIILCFGSTGRMANICSFATRLIHPNAKYLTHKRDGYFTGDVDKEKYLLFKDLVLDNSSQEFLVIDASVDHSSLEAMVTHESFKHDCIRWLSRNNLLLGCIGFSSGITLIKPNQITANANHMLEYRHQKLKQEELFASLSCPIFLPKLFTVVGPLTYVKQSTAWAKILKARVKSQPKTVLNDPHAYKAWASEFEIFKQILAFLNTDKSSNFTHPIVQGAFTLAGIAGSRLLPFPCLPFDQGDTLSWLIGDYVPPLSMKNSYPIEDELLRVLNF